MEPAGLTVGVLALAGLFNNAVDCFEYVQIGRNFGKSSQTSLVKLGNTQLRLSRWGKSVGLDVDDIRNTELQTLERVFEQRTVRKAANTLGQVLSLFADAENQSKAFAGEAQLETVHDRTQLPLVQQMRQLSLARQNRTALKQKWKWALHGEKEFKVLVTEVSDLVKDLEELFPATKEARQELAGQELAVLGTPQSLPILEEAASSEEVDDQALQEAIARRESGDELQRTFYGLVRSLLHQLLSQQVQLLREFVDSSQFAERCRNQGEPGVNWKWSEHELQTSFSHLIHKFSRHHLAKMYIDGIDEAGDESAVRIVQYLTRMVDQDSAPGSGVNLCFACRPYPDVVWSRDFTIHVEAENQKDIESYISDALGTKLDQITRESIQTDLYARSSGVFRWVALNIPRLLQYCASRQWMINLESVSRQIRKLPKGLSETYIDMFSGFDQRDATEALAAFWWIAYSTQTLTLEVFKGAMFYEGILPNTMVDSGDSEYDDLIRWASTISRGLIIVVGEFAKGDPDTWSIEAVDSFNEAKIQFDHESVREFMLDEGLALLLGMSNRDHVAKKRLHNPHSYMTMICSKLCLEACHREENREERGSLDSHITDLEQYARKQWLIHARAAEKLGSAPWKLTDLTEWPSTELLELLPLNADEYGPQSDTFSSTKERYKRFAIPATLIHLAAREGWQRVVQDILHRERSWARSAGKGRRSQSKQINLSREVRAWRFEASRTPLESAAGTCQPNMARFLLDRGAIPTRTAVKLADEYGDRQTIQLIRDAESEAYGPAESSRKPRRSRRSRSGERDNIVWSDSESFP